MAAPFASSPANLSVFVARRFWLLVVFSVVLPLGIDGLLLRVRAISRMAVLGLGIVLVLVCGVDACLLQSLASVAKGTPSMAEEAWFRSEILLAVSMVPVVFGGIGVNLSHVLRVRHRTKAKKRFDPEHCGDA